MQGSGSGHVSVREPPHPVTVMLPMLLRRHDKGSDGLVASATVLKAVKRSDRGSRRGIAS